MLFLMQIPGLLLWTLGLVLSIVASGSILIGLAYTHSPSWLIVSMSSLPLLIFFIVDIVNDSIIVRLTRKWHSVGLRYAKHAKDCDESTYAAKAAKYFMKAALFKDSASIINLGLCYAKGFGVDKNLAKAATCYKIVATRFDPYGIAEIALGFCYAKGIGVEHDLVKAEDWYKKANEGSCFNIFFNQLWCSTCNPLDDFWNPLEVITWIRNAAECGNVRIQLTLGVCYEKGIGITADQVEADRWIRKAAEQDYAEAQYKLGYNYQFGDGVITDELEAVKWYRKAAEQGHREAIKELEVLESLLKINRAGERQ